MADDDLESLLARHKREQKALVSQITSLKKTVTKGEKSKRKEILLEVERLEKELKERHENELKEFKSSGGASKDETSKSEVENGENSMQPDVVGFEHLKLDESTPVNRSGKPKVNRQKARIVTHTAAHLADTI
jgi:OTU domain-containing protein 6